MKTKSYENVHDRTRWGEGPWDEERADKVQWQDKTTGLPCLAVRGPLGSWCGYVGVTRGHPLYGLEYSADEAAHLRVHGGLTFSAGCDPTAEESHGICHLPEPGEPDDVWWLGFDTAHAGDAVPGLRAFRELGETYRDLRYVKREVRDLARQIAETK